MELITKEIAQALPPLYSQEALGDQALVQLKLFCPWSNWTWYATEYDPVERICFGLVDGYEKELGLFSLDELDEITGPGGLRIERDIWWEPCSLAEARSR